jgi:large subunit ribosomal protein L25
MVKQSNPQKLTLQIEERKLVGRKVKTLRKSGLLPGNIYGKNVKSLSVQVPIKDFLKTYEIAGETNLVDLILGKQTKPVLITNLQIHPVTDEPLHVDFHQVDLKQKVKATIPVNLEGESPAEKSGLGTVVLLLDELEVEALPMDLPDSFIIDVSTLETENQAIYVKDLKYDRSKITLNADPEQILVKVEPPQKEEEVIVPAPEVPAEEAVETTAETPQEETPSEEQSKSEA